MIRESRTEDMASILTLWMESTIYAHPFYRSALLARKRSDSA
ncbi:acetyltransferase [Citrobacter koseri]|nr:acetyltransferase [Citrobacter koseri]